MILVGHCIAYVTWFGAVERLPASVAAIGTMLVPVIGVVVSAIALHEPLGRSQIAALVLHCRRCRAGSAIMSGDCSRWPSSEP
jgi:drug/metabolite transporter (DMT)-like permease